MVRRMLLPWLLLVSLSLWELGSAGQPFLIDAGHQWDRLSYLDRQQEDLVDSLRDSPLGKNLNEIVDLIIEIAKEDLQKSGRSTIPIPDIEEDFHKRIYFISITGKFKAENGWFKDLSTIHRTADATLSRSGGNITASVGLGLGIMQVGYEHYRVKVKHFSVSGKIRAEVESNSVIAQVNVKLLPQGKCQLTLQELRIDRFSGLKVKIEGQIKPLNWLYSKISTSIANHMKDKFIHEAEQRLIEAAQKALNKYHC